MNSAADPFRMGWCLTREARAQSLFQLYTHKKPLQRHLILKNSYFPRLGVWEKFYDLEDLFLIRRYIFLICKAQGQWLWSPLCVTEDTSGSLIFFSPSPVGIADTNSQPKNLYSCGARNSSLMVNH